MKTLIFDQLDSRTFDRFKMHLTILAVVTFGLREHPNFVFVKCKIYRFYEIYFTFCSGGESVYMYVLQAARMSN